MAKLTKKFRTPKLTEREELEKQIIEAKEIEAEIRWMDLVDEEEDDSIWEGGIFI